MSTFAKDLLHRNQQKRAAESRVFNQECVILNFYDYHDIWHFLSAASLFFSFMVVKHRSL